MAGGESAEVPVRRGSNTVYVRLQGAGHVLEISGATADMELCVGSGVVGVLRPG